MFSAEKHSCQLCCFRCELGPPLLCQVPFYFGRQGKGTGGDQSFEQPSSNAFLSKIPKGVLKNVTSSGSAVRVGICLIWGFVDPFLIRVGPIERKSGEVRHIVILDCVPCDCTAENSISKDSFLDSSVDMPWSKVECVGWQGAHISRAYC